MTFVTPDKEQKTKERKRKAPAEPHSDARFSTELSRHDHHNLEIRTVAELSDDGLKSELEVFFFVPPSFQIHRWNITKIHDDFRSRVRLALPTRVIEGNLALDSAMKQLRECCERMEGASFSEEILQELDHPTWKDLREATKILGAILGETLRKQGKDHSREIFLSHSLASEVTFSVDKLKDLTLLIQGTAATIRTMRAEIASLPFHHLPLFQLLNEHASNLYVRYLATLSHELEAQALPASRSGFEPFVAARLQLIAILEALQKNEANYRQPFGVEDEGHEFAHEHELVRMSQLKKFFQSKMFIDVTRLPANTRVNESAAAVGAACAAIWATACQQVTSPSWTGVAHQSTFLFSFGVVAYVMKDRLKEWARKVLNRRVGRYLPDFEEHLFAEEEKIGAIREWYRVKKGNAVPEEIRQLRSLACHSRVEAELPEDVIYFRKIQDTQSMRLRLDTGTGDHTWAVQENIRINVERYLKHMDDPFKEMIYLDDEGSIHRRKSHRVYHFYMGLRSSLSPQEMPSPMSLRKRPEPDPNRPAQYRFYRVVMDKSGINRVEDLKVRHCERSEANPTLRN